jgi:hypothetical protein
MGEGYAYLTRELGGDRLGYAYDHLYRLRLARWSFTDVEAWLAAGDPLRQLASGWFQVLRACGPDVRELMHDHQPTACVHDAAFAYVDAFTGHANLGFFFGSALPDPAGLLQGTGKRMRHIKLRAGRLSDPAAVQALIDAAYADVRRRLAAE